MREAVEIRHRHWVGTHFQGIHLRNLGRVNCEITGRNSVGLPAYTHGCPCRACGNAWALRGISAKVVNDSVPKGISRNRAELTCFFRAARSFKDGEEKQTVLYQRPPYRAPEHVADEFRSYVWLPSP